MQRRRQNTSSYGFAPHRRFSPLLLIEALIIAILAFISGIIFARWVFGPPSIPADRFRVQDNRIYDLYGKPFIVKGVTSVYGRFSGGDANGFGLTNYYNAQR